MCKFHVIVILLLLDGLTIVLGLLSLPDFGLRKRLGIELEPGSKQKASNVVKKERQAKKRVQTKMMKVKVATPKLC